LLLAEGANWTNIANVISDSAAQEYEVQHFNGHNLKRFDPDLVIDDSRDIKREYASGIDDLAEIDIEDHAVTLADPCARPR
jgi:hypothetical protein